MDFINNGARRGLFSSKPCGLAIPPLAGLAKPAATARRYQGEAVPYVGISGSPGLGG